MFNFFFLHSAIHFYIIEVIFLKISISLLHNITLATTVSQNWVFVVNKFTEYFNESLKFNPCPESVPT